MDNDALFIGVLLHRNLLLNKKEYWDTQSLNPVQTELGWLEVEHNRH